MNIPNPYQDWSKAPIEDILNALEVLKNHLPSEIEYDILDAAQELLHQYKDLQR